MLRYIDGGHRYNRIAEPKTVYSKPSRKSAPESGGNARLAKIKLPYSNIIDYEHR
jgi:hypothetical protein